MSSVEFSLWMQYHSEAPIDDSRADFHAAIIAATIANYAGKTRSENAPPVTPKEFMPFQFLPAQDAEVEPDPIKFFSQFK